MHKKLPCTTFTWHYSSMRSAGGQNSTELSIGSNKSEGCVSLILIIYMCVKQTTFFISVNNSFDNFLINFSYWSSNCDFNKLKKKKNSTD